MLGAVYSKIMEYISLVNKQGFSCDTPMNINDRHTAKSWGTVLKM